MTKKEIILNEIQKVRKGFTKYSNINFQNDDDFEPLLRAFGREELKKNIYFYLYKRIDSVTYRLFSFYEKNNYCEISIDDFELIDSSDFDLLLSGASFFGKAMLEGATFGILKSRTLELSDFKSVAVDVSEIDDVIYRKGVLSFLLNSKEFK